MPPPRQPHFLPRQPRRLDPTRHLKSRELWNRVRFHASSPAPIVEDDGFINNNINGNDEGTSGGNGGRGSGVRRRKPWKYYQALLQAILYELQPFRILPFLRRLHTFIIHQNGLRSLLSSTYQTTLSLLSLLHSLAKQTYQSLIQPNLNRHSLLKMYTAHKTLLLRTIPLTLASLYLYYRTLLYLHETLHAGPMFFLLSAFVALYTVGLGDGTGAESGIPSAYSVFNRGVRRILGTVDGEELARQFAGGVAAAGGGGGGGGRGNVWVGDDDDGDGGFWVEDDDYDEREREEDIVRERRRRRRLERLQQRRHQEGNINNNDHENNDVGRNEDVLDDNQLMLEGDNENEGRDNFTDNDDANGNSSNRLEGGGTAATAGARKSGKKARRRNLELRREMQRQRQAAHALGFGAGNGNEDLDGNVIAELEALNRFVED